MMIFFKVKSGLVYGLLVQDKLPIVTEKKLSWLFHSIQKIQHPIPGTFIGPRAGSLSPWCTNAQDVLHSIGIPHVLQIERFRVWRKGEPFDALLEQKYEGLNDDILQPPLAVMPTQTVQDIAAYHAQEGLALSASEIAYLEGIATSYGRLLYDVEVYGFAQVNSEHCRHKIFNGHLVLDGKKQPYTLFEWIKKTTREHPNLVVSAYTDNVAFVKGPRWRHFAPRSHEGPDFYDLQSFESVLSLKAETHNFPTTVEPLYGAGTGTGGEIRDRMAGGQGACPLAGTAVYMSGYPRLGPLPAWTQACEPKTWRYHKPEDTLIKASNGASDYGNKFGQPLICGSVLTFEHRHPKQSYGYDKVVMLAGGVGMTQKAYAHKGELRVGDKVVLMGGDNYRIGMGGSAVSSVATGKYSDAVAQSAIQRANPEMQKRVADAVRAMTEEADNPIVSIHDHGAGGHLNCFAELIEDKGCTIDLESLPKGDPSLSEKELICNESQERMGLVLRAKDIERARRIAKREQAPFYVVGEIEKNPRLVFKNKKGQTPFCLQTKDLLGPLPPKVVEDQHVSPTHRAASVRDEHLYAYVRDVLRMEAVGCKDWLTNKVDRCVGGRVAKQPCCGVLQLPLNNVGVMMLDFVGRTGIATSLGHAPVAALTAPAKSVRLALAEALGNLVWAPLSHGLKGVSLSANWMWPNQKGDYATLYEAVQALSTFACEMGINIPTGKDSLSMTQQYPEGHRVSAPGTVVLSTLAEVADVAKVIEPVLQADTQSALLYVPLGTSYGLGGSAWAQTQSTVGGEVPDVIDAVGLVRAFEAVQDLIKADQLLAGHDVSSGGLITALLEMCFPSLDRGMAIDLSALQAPSLTHLLLSEAPGWLLQVKDQVAAEKILQQAQVNNYAIGQPVPKATLQLGYQTQVFEWDIAVQRRYWFEPSYRLETLQSSARCARQRQKALSTQALSYRFPAHFTGHRPAIALKHKPIAAVLREKGSNSDREMAYALHLAGFKVKDVHMSDLIEGRERLEGVGFLAFVGGFSHADVLGAARGWAAAFRYNEGAAEVLERFYSREDVLSFGACNGCQLMMTLGLLYPEWAVHPRMEVNASQKFESAFTTLHIEKNPSVMFSSMAGARLGVWVAHREGRFVFAQEDKVQITARYAYAAYPGNPNGSVQATACLSSTDGRHVAIMPHIERSLFPWNWAYYPAQRKQKDQVSPWIEPFVNARKWLLRA